MHGKIFATGTYGGGAMGVRAHLYKLSAATVDVLAEGYDAMRLAIQAVDGHSALMAAFSMGQAKVALDVCKLRQTARTEHDSYFT
jgi:hypothetical protein